MSEITSSQYMTHIRETFTPSRPLEESLNVFLEHPTGNLRLYSTADRRVPTQTYHSDEYQRRNV